MLPGYSTGKRTIHISVNASSPLPLHRPDIDWTLESLQCPPESSGDWPVFLQLSPAFLLQASLTVNSEVTWLSLPTSLDAQTSHCSSSAKCICPCLLLVTAHLPLLQDKSQCPCQGTTVPRDVTAPNSLTLSPATFPITHSIVTTWPLPCSFSGVLSLATKLFPQIPTTCSHSYLQQVTAQWGQPAHLT